MSPIRSTPIIFVMLPIVAGALCASAHTLAQESTLADAFFNKGKANMAVGNYSVACPAFEESYKIEPLMGALFHLALCHEAAGQYAFAVDRFKEYLHKYDLLPQADKKVQDSEDRSAIAAQKILVLSSLRSSVIITLPTTAPAGTKVILDGTREIDEQTWGLKVYLNPGVHELRVRLPNGSEGLPKSIKLNKGEPRSIEMEVPTVSTAEPPKPAKVTVVPLLHPQPSEPEKSSAIRNAAYVVGGMGVAGLGVGLVMGAMVWDRSEYIAEHCPRGQCDSQTAVDTHADTQFYGRVSEIGFGVGLLGIGVSTALFIVSKPAKKPSMGMLTVDVNSLGTSGLMGRIEGRW